MVAAQKSRSVAVVDLGALTVVKHIPLGGEPTQMLAHPARPAVYAFTPSTGTVYEIATASLGIARKFSLGRPAQSMLLDPDGQSLWLAAIANPQLVRVSLGSFRPEARIPLPAVPFHFDITGRGRQGPHAAVSFGNSGQVAIIDTGKERLVHHVHVGQNAGLVRFRLDGEHVLVANPAERRLAILDTESGAAVTDLLLAVRPDQLCFNNDGGQLFITGEGMDAVVVVYPYRTEIAQTRLAGHSPGAMAVSGTGYLFVANPKAGDVTIIEIETQRVIAVAAVGAEPGFIALTPNDQYALILNRASGDMAVIRLGAIKVDSRRSAPLLTMIPVGSRPVSAAVKAL